MPEDKSCVELATAISSTASSIGATLNGNLSDGKILSDALNDTREQFHNQRGNWTGPAQKAADNFETTLKELETEASQVKADDQASHGKFFASAKDKITSTVNTIQTECSNVRN